jgi:hypothetical protein
MEQNEVQYGVWYVMDKNFSGWSLYKRTKETVACAYPSDTNGRINYTVWGSPTAGGTLQCEAKAFSDSCIRVATEDDAKMDPLQPLT